MPPNKLQYSATQLFNPPTHLTSPHRCTPGSVARQQLHPTLQGVVKLWDSTPLEAHTPYSVALRILNKIHPLVQPLCLPAATADHSLVQPPQCFTHPVEVIKQQGGSPQSLCVTINTSKVTSTAGAYLLDGYVRLTVGTNWKGKAVEVFVHHIVCWATRGLPHWYHPTATVCMHLCHNKLCVNPSHLLWGTVAAKAHPTAQLGGA